MIPARAALPALLLVVAPLLAPHAAEAGPLSWRSELYPETWGPDYQLADGRFLHDFSHAGYHNGEAQGRVAAGAPRFDVTDYGADPGGQRDSRAAVQAAIDAAQRFLSLSTRPGMGAVVWFPEGLYRLDGPVQVGASGMVLAGEGPEASRLWFTQSTGMSYRSHVTLAGRGTTAAELPLAAEAANRAREVLVEDATGLRVGDDVALGWTITDAFVAEHGMIGTWRVFNGDWQPFFRRQVEAIEPGAPGEPDRIVLDLPIRYPALLRDGASLRVETGYLRECGVSGLGFADATDRAAAWAQNQVHVLEMRHVADCWIRDVASFPSPGSDDLVRGEPAHLQSGGILVRDSKRVTVEDSRMENAQHRGGGGNGYLFEVRTSSEVLFQDLVGRNGRHNFIQNWGFGTSGWVLHRVHSEGGEALFHPDLPGLPGASEFHHSLAMANLVDASTFHDAFQAINRGHESSGAGHSATQTVLWSTAGPGYVRSAQVGHGYVIGTAPTLTVWTHPAQPGGEETAPEDWVEGLGLGGLLEPQSLYEDQLERRLARTS